MLNPRSWQSQKFLRAFIWLMLFSGLSFNVHSASNDFLWEYNVTGLTQSFKSLSEAEAAMRSMADKELSSGVTEMHNKLQFAYMANSNTRRYTIPPLPAKIGPWVYWVPYTPGGPYDNEQAAVQNVIDYFSYDGCQTTAAPTSDWYVYPGANQEYMIFWLASVQFKRDYKASIDCPNRMPRVTTFSALISRAASPVCPTNYPPKYSEYTQALQDPPGNTNVLVSKGCQNYTIGTITSRMVNALCDKDRNPQRGNPCNPATGNKHETEEDFPGLEAVGINFKRSYNSLQINHAQTALGMGWTHSYGTQLLGSPSAINWGSGHTEELRWVATNVYVSAQASGRQLRLSGNEWVLTHPSGAREVFDKFGRLLRQESASGQITTLNYDSKRRLERVTGPFGHNLHFTYDTSGKLVAVTDDLNRSVQYAYSNDRLTQVTYPDGNVRTYHYEASNLPTHLTGISLNGARYSTFAYDERGRAILSEHDGGMERHTFSYNADGTTTVNDAASNATVYYFTNPSNVPRVVSKEVDSAGTRSRTYDANWRLTSRTNERGVKATYTYDSFHRTRQTEAADTTQAHTTNYQYLSDQSDLLTVIETPSVYAGQTARVQLSYLDSRFPQLPTTITQSGFTPSGEPVSRSVGLAYNVQGQIIAVDGPRTDLADVTLLEYYNCNSGGHCGQLKSSTNALGQVTLFDDYDAAGRLGRITHPNGLETRYTYDVSGQLNQMTQTAPSGGARVTTYSYTAFGAIASVTQPDGLVLTYAYDGAHKLRTVTDSLGNSVRYSYDDRGNRISEELFNPDGTQARGANYDYDIRNRIQSIGAVIDASRTSFTLRVFDALDNLLAESAPNSSAGGTMQATTHQYDNLNRLFQTTDVLAGTTSYGYDINDQLTQVTAPNDAVTTYAYDDLGNRLSEASPDRGTLSYTYDAAGNMTSRQDARGITVNYSYDALNRVTSIDYPGSDEDVQLSYDCSTGIGRLCEVADGSGTQLHAYDAFGNVLSHTRTGQWGSYTTQYGYDAADRITSINSTNGHGVRYVRDALGRVSGVTAVINGQEKELVTGRTYRVDGLYTGQNFGNGLVETRTYDLSGRLGQQTLGSESRNYGYDWNGNLTLLQKPTQNDEFHYDGLDRLLDFTQGSEASVSYVYDSNGNRLNETQGALTQTYSYAGGSNRLQTRTGVTITHDAAGNRTGDGVHIFTYNAANRLYQVYENGQLVATYAYNGHGQRVRKATATGITFYHYDLNGQLMAETQADGSALRDYVWLDEQPLAQIETNNEVHYLHTDHLSTPRQATNSTGQVVWRWEGDPFGSSKPNEDPDGDDTELTVNLRFPGQYYDAESGLHYNYFRDYDPSLGRYVESDPIGLKGGLNTYGYVEGNPVGAIDPSGLVKKDGTIAPPCVPGFETMICSPNGGVGPLGGLRGGLNPQGELAQCPVPNGVGRSGALNAAKRDLGTPRSQHPDAVNRVPMTRNGKAILGPDGKPIMTREYTYTRPDGSKAVIQDHSAGHQFDQGGVGDKGPHFNVRPPENTRTGSVPGTKDHYYW